MQGSAFLTVAQGWRLVHTSSTNPHMLSRKGSSVFCSECFSGVKALMSSLVQTQRTQDLEYVHLNWDGDYLQGQGEVSEGVQGPLPLDAGSGRRRRRSQIAKRRIENLLFREAHLGLTWEVTEQSEQAKF